ncbi:hypothetical protein K3728_00200 [Rhodobacteraceae bacterium M385]|nr:hypothetical protein K3728_00200 [Rhodobacteraceae bacterium M385]
MRLHPLLAALLAGVPSAAAAQLNGPLHIGLPWEVFIFEADAFAEISTNGANLVLTTYTEAWPDLAYYVENSPPQGLSLSFCGMEFANFYPTSSMATGRLVIPFGDPAVATLAADVLTGRATCDSFEGPTQDAGDTSLLPSLSPTLAPIHGPVLRSPSDTYEALAEEIMEARAATVPETGSIAINLTFGPGLAAWLATETGEHIGEQIELSICQEVITAPRVMEPITGGTISISGSYNMAEAETLAARIRGDIPCED